MRRGRLPRESATRLSPSGSVPFPPGQAAVWLWGPWCRRLVTRPKARQRVADARTRVPVAQPLSSWLPWGPT